MMNEHIRTNWWLGGIALVLGASAVLFGLIMSATLSGGTAGELAARLPWYVSRAAGITAYLLLSMSTLLGLTISTRLLDRWVSRADAFALHEHLPWLALGSIVLHAGVLLFDSYQPFNLAQVLLPLTSDYRPFAVAIGIIGLYLAALLVASFYVRAWLGQRRWRLLHYASFALYALATLHGMVAASGDAWMHWVYLASGGAVLLLINYRILVEPRTVRRRA